MFIGEEYPADTLSNSTHITIEVEPRLLPCPFCASTEIEVIRIGTKRNSCVIRCENCGCTLESNEIGFGEAWNKRRYTPPI